MAVSPTSTASVASPKFQAGDTIKSVVAKEILKRNPNATQAEINQGIHRVIMDNRTSGLGKSDLVWQSKPIGKSLDLKALDVSPSTARPAGSAVTTTRGGQTSSNVQARINALSGITPGINSIGGGNNPTLDEISRRPVPTTFGQIFAGGNGIGDFANQIGGQTLLQNRGLFLDLIG